MRLLGTPDEELLLPLHEHSKVTALRSLGIVVGSAFKVPSWRGTSAGGTLGVEHSTE